MWGLLRLSVLPKQNSRHDKKLCTWMEPVVISKLLDSTQFHIQKDIPYVLGRTLPYVTIVSCHSLGRSLVDTATLLAEEYYDKCLLIACMCWLK